MAVKGDVIDNPVTGERITFLQTSRDTGGALVEFELVVAPGGAPVAAHVHPFQSERFRVVKGTLSARVAGREQILAAGEEMTVLAGTPHSWKNATDELLQVLIEFRPALRWESLFETMFGLARDGKTDRRGRPNLLQAAVIFTEFRHEAGPASQSDRLLFKLLPLLALLGRSLGYRPTDPDYSNTGV